MSDSTTTDKPTRKPWLFTLTKAQLFNDDAEELGTMNWFLFAYLVLLIVLCTCIPLFVARLRNDAKASDANSYPGIVQTFAALKASGREISIANGELSIAPNTPAEETLPGWKVLWEQAGASQPQARIPNDESQQGSYSDSWTLFVGKSGLTILKPDGTMAAGGSWRLLEGFKLSQTEIDAGMISAVLGSIAMAQTPSALWSIFIMVALQDCFFILVLGAFMTLSGIKIGMGEVSPKRKKGFTRSLRSTAAVLLGPALVTAIASLFIPYLIALSYLLFAFLGGTRVIILYISRFPDKTREASPVEKKRRRFWRKKPSDD